MALWSKFLFVTGIVVQETDVWWLIRHINWASADSFSVHPQLRLYSDDRLYHTPPVLHPQYFPI